MAVDFIQEDCIGLEVLINLVDGAGAPVSLAGSSAAYMLFQNPNGSTSTKTASVVSDGSTGQITYTTVSGDLNSAGTWKYQGKVTWGGGAIFFSEVQRLKVKANLA